MEEACLKQGFDILTHRLRYQSRMLDLALPLRLTNLPNNATVEMVQSADVDGGVPVQIHIALQVRVFELISCRLAYDEINCYLIVSDIGNM